MLYVSVLQKCVSVYLQEIEALEAAIDRLREQRQDLKKEFDEQVRTYIGEIPTVHYIVIGIKRRLCRCVCTAHDYRIASLFRG